MPTSADLTCVRAALRDVCPLFTSLAIPGQTAAAAADFAFTEADLPDFATAASAEQQASIEALVVVAVAGVTGRGGAATEAAALALAGGSASVVGGAEATGIGSGSASFFLHDARGTAVRNSSAAARLW